jgi:hypothetical protein
MNTPTPSNIFKFCVLDKFEDIEFNDEQRVLLNQPSHLTDVLLINNYWGGNAMDMKKRKYRLLNFTGTTNEEAIKKILTFYKHKTYRRLLSHHIFFEGFDFVDGKATIWLGS